jgi:signal transduction histidine kinase
LIGTSQGSLEVATNFENRYGVISNQLGSSDVGVSIGVQMSAASVIEQAPLISDVHPNGDVGEQQLRPLLAAEKDKLQQTSADLTESRSLAMLGNMAQFVVHDLRHHLCAIYANAEFMCNESNDLGDREELFGGVREAIVCMTEQLDALLLLSRTGSMFHLRRQPLKHLVERATQMVRSHPDTDQVNITIEDMPLIEGHVDGKWIHSAIFNLLLNACQAARIASGPKAVSIALHQDLCHIDIRVTDSGPGVPRSIQKSLFQPFVSADRRGGMGLGLTIAQCVARGHGGDVYLEESRPGRTSFVLRLPNPALGKRNFFTSTRSLPEIDG